MLEKASKTDVIFFLLRHGGAEHGIHLSTTALAEEIGVSQQTASRWLIELEDEGLIARARGGLKVTDACIDRCRTLYSLLRGVFETSRFMEIKGTATAGLGDGRYYLALPEYKAQVRKKLGFLPYEGTLNILVPDREKKLALSNMPGIEIRGFINDGRMLGAAKCFKCSVNGKFGGAVIIPARSHYGLDVLEVISPKNLRGELGLKDGSSVTLKVKKE
jgi:riboflavin kinase